MKLIRFTINTLSNFLRYGTNGLREIKIRDQKIETQDKTIRAQSTLLAAKK